MDRAGNQLMHYAVNYNQDGSVQILVQINQGHLLCWRVYLAEDGQIFYEIRSEHFVRKPSVLDYVQQCACCKMDSHAMIDTIMIDNMSLALL